MRSAAVDRANAPDAGDARVRDLPTVSVVVPALDCADDVDGFVDAISRQRYPVERRELIVVDNGSTDATVARLKARGIEAAASPERGRTGR